MNYSGVFYEIQNTGGAGTLGRRGISVGIKNPPFGGFFSSEPKHHSLFGLSFLFLAHRFFFKAFARGRRFFVTLALFAFAVQPFLLGFSFRNAQRLFDIVVADHNFYHV